MFRCGSFDVVGVGFGPSNLALAVAVAEHNTTTPGERLSARFVERQSTFGWHRGMLLEDATMQISFLKDLATLRNPVSPYGFLSYLHDRGRLIDFINYGSAFPTRLEFHDYLEWVAGRFVDDVDYRTTVTSIDPVPDASEFLDIRTSDGATMRTRNVVVATGLAANLPDGVVPGERIWHTRDLLTRTDRPVDPRRVIVVGAGQSAAEAVDHFHRRFESAEVWAVFNRYGYSPADDTPFANRVFDPGAVDDFFGAPPEVKQMILGYHANTNYSVVDPELIESLYRRHYHEKISGRERLRFLNVSRIDDVVASRDHVELVLESMLDGGREAVRADLVVYATGYRPSDPCDLLGDLTGSCLRDDAGRLSINRDYRVATDPALRAGIYVQGATEHTHGLSSTLLSNIAVRSGEIVQSIAERTSALV
ncbi:MAG: lysine N(6)-hydroxylase/L-ornithine N(5)-oxygenase family protein [Pseudonocardia sp.]|nr:MULTISPECIES: SidA/IucD/PvdA family monooxygenase [unclassified Pseudonocardia]MBN9113254.1 lysine N(6)-hydroxylase/L-ornithine N(5)-oxygenase family protein [Pseudonocardia sp.]ODU26245.1 MAG: L-lysine 6-monooxygenase [Pseudonocardia sp. SCN 72-51]ODV00847.1 MAG: L-lysine 6-monooxygenase [Pseudonocardia sp. SCN 73-27]